MHGLQALLDDEPRSGLRFGVYLCEVLPNNSKAQQLDSSQHVERNYDRSPTRDGGGVEESNN